MKSTIRTWEFTLLEKRKFYKNTKWAPLKQEEWDIQILKHHRIITRIGMHQRLYKWEKKRESYAAHILKRITKMVNCRSTSPPPTKEFNNGIIAMLNKNFTDHKISSWIKSPPHFIQKGKQISTKVMVDYHSEDHPK